MWVNLKLEALLALTGLKPLEEINNPQEAYQEYLRGEEIKNLLSTYLEALRLKLFAYAEEQGVKDGKGAWVMQFSDGTGYKKEPRTRVSINEDRAVAFAKSKGFNDLLKQEWAGDEMALQRALQWLEQNTSKEHMQGFGLEKVERFDEDALEVAFMESRVTSEEVESIIDRKVNYALRKIK